MNERLYDFACCSLIAIFIALLAWKYFSPPIHTSLPSLDMQRPSLEIFCGTLRAHPQQPWRDRSR